jgi:hypothetical protein
VKAKATKKANKPLRTVYLLRTMIEQVPIQVSEERLAQIRAKPEVYLPDLSLAHADELAKSRKWRASHIITEGRLVYTARPKEDPMIPEIFNANWV